MYEFLVWPLVWGEILFLAILYLKSKLTSMIIFCGFLSSAFHYLFGFELAGCR